MGGVPHQSLNHYCIYVFDFDFDVDDVLFCRATSGIELLEMPTRGRLHSNIHNKDGSLEGVGLLLSTRYLGNIINKPSMHEINETIG